MSNKPHIVGITGGIGSGKTTVCKIFETMGARTYYADDRAKWLMENDDQLIKNIKALFGEEAYREDKLDRKHIASMAFKDDSLLEQLNGLVHPAVSHDVVKWIDENQDARLLLKEAALLFETGSYKALDKNILVTAPEDIRILRVVSRDSHRSEQDVKNIIENQMKDEEKRPLADFVIENDGNQSVIKQVMNIYEELIVA
ncbi:dephospho-CoA kinase [Ekhidna sp.]|uniref:dephospho-CoA kinase n=1 Tax=Ekhidna sp. TaxID=2608089 RepID=UPI003C7A6968